MAGLSDIVSFDNPVFASYAFYSALSICKMMDMSIWTSIKRFQRMAFANNEDAAMAAGMASSQSEKEKRATPRSDDAVERVRRNHLNDMENIPAFVMLGFFYVLTRPDPHTATWIFRVFFGSRILHTIAYQHAIPQPARALSFGVGFASCLPMAYRIIQQSWSHY